MTGDLPPRLTTQQIENRIYLQLRRDYLKAHPVCERCGQAPAVVIHHKVSRQTHLNDVSVFMACCKPCERSFHTHPKKVKVPASAKGAVWLKQPEKRMPVLQIHMCHFKANSPGRSCWGTVEFRHVYKGAQHIASYWLCARHRDMLLFGGQTLAIPTISPSP